MTHITASYIHPKQRSHQGVVNGRWVIEASACPYNLHPAGTLVCEPAPPGTDQSLTFTALDGHKYMDTVEGSQWTPRNEWEAIP